MLVHRSSISLDISFRQEIYQKIQDDNFYASILYDLENGDQAELHKRKEKYKIKDAVLCIHLEEQSDEVEYWRFIIPNDTEIKKRILKECHSVPYSAHPGVQRTLSRIRRVFCWKRMTVDIREFVESCPICQTEKSEHTLTRGQLQNMNIPVEKKWQEVSIDFVTNLPDACDGINSIMTVINKATRMISLIHCNKSISATQTAKLHMQYIVKLHGIPRAIHTDRGTQFVSKFCKELWGLLGTSLRYSTAFHPQTQGIIERMNAVIRQMLRCTIHEMNEGREWKKLLPMIELTINLFVNRSTGYTPFFLNYRFDPIVPADLIKGNERVQNESVGDFCSRLKFIWGLERNKTKQAMETEARYYYSRHRPVTYREGQLVLLSTVNLRAKNIPRKLQRKFVGPFRVMECPGTQSYRLELPSHWGIHSVFHVSLIKPWKERNVYASTQFR